MSSWRPTACGRARATSKSEHVAAAAAATAGAATADWAARARDGVRVLAGHEQNARPPPPSLLVRSHARYEKARKLKQFIGGIRREYTRDWASRDRKERQVSLVVQALAPPSRRRRSRRRTTTTALPPPLLMRARRWPPLSTLSTSWRCVRGTRRTRTRPTRWAAARSRCVLPWLAGMRCLAPLRRRAAAHRRARPPSCAAHRPPPGGERRVF